MTQIDIDTYRIQIPQGFVCVASAAYSPPSYVLAFYWSIVVCYWSISQSKTTTQLGGEKAALHKVQQHKRTLVILSKLQKQYLSQVKLTKPFTTRAAQRLENCSSQITLQITF